MSYTPVPPVGQDDMAGSLPVVIASDQSAVPVSGTVTSNLSATDNAVLDDIALNQTDASQKTQIVDGAGNVIGATSNALDVNIKSGSSSGTQYTEADTDASITGTAMMWEDAADTLVAASAAKPIPVSLPSATVTTLTPPAAITGFATEAKQLADGHSVALSATDNAVLDQIDTNTDSGAVVGAGAAATAQRVHLADESLSALENITVTSSGTVTANAGTDLNTSALALEAGGNLAAIKAKTDNIPALGQALAEASVPVILPAATVTTLTPPAAITGFALETGGNIAAIKAKTDNIPALGQALAAASVPVILPSDTITTLTPPAAITGFALETGGNLAAAATSLGVLDNAISGSEMQVDIVAALPAGTNAIGKLAANSGVDIGDVDVTSAVITGGAVAHDAADSGNPIKIGLKAIAHGTNPTAVAAADRTDVYANRAGIQFMIGGHPNIITKNFNVSDADGAQTNADILGAIGAGAKVVVTAIDVMADQATTAATAVRIGFGASAVPALDAAGIIVSHGGIAPGSGIVKGNGSGIIGIGGDGEELRVTCEDPAGGCLDITVTYYTIES